MNKVVILGIIIAAAIVIGLVLVTQISNPPDTVKTQITSEKPSNSTAKHFSIELEETEKITQHP